MIIPTFIVKHYKKQNLSYTFQYKIISSNLYRLTSNNIKKPKSIVLWIRIRKLIGIQNFVNLYLSTGRVLLKINLFLPDYMGMTIAPKSIESGYCFFLYTNNLHTINFSKPTNVMLFLIDWLYLWNIYLVYIFEIFHVYSNFLQM